VPGQGEAAGQHRLQERGVGGQAHRLAVLGQRLLGFSLRLQGEPEPPVAEEVMGVEVDGGAVMGQLRRVVAAQVGVQPRDGAGHERERIELPRVCDLAAGLLEAAEHREVDAAPLAHGGGVRAELGRAVQLAPRGGPVPVLEERDVGARDVRLGQSFVAIEGLARFGVRALPGRRRWQHAREPEDQAGVGETGMGQRVAGVPLRGFLERLERPLQPGAGEAAPEVAALEVGLLRFEVLGVPVREERLLGLAQLQGQRPRHLLRHRVLDREESRHLPLERLGPRRPVAVHGNELHADPQPCSLALQGAVHDRVHLERPPRFVRIQSRAAVLEDGARGAHGQASEAAQPGDERIGEADGQDIRRR
jgi:hypothetical protein